MSDDNLLTVSALLNKKVYLPLKKKEGMYRRVGKVRRFVFHPTAKRVIGIIVKRPDAAMMFHRPDLFVAIDRLTVVDEGVIAQDEPDSFDQKACRRLGVDWSKCLLWLGMELVTESGEKLGCVGDVAFEPESGRVAYLRRNEGATARLLLGVENIPASMINGFRYGVGSQMADYHEEEKPADSNDVPAEEAENFGAIVVDDAVVDLDPEGGLAEKAGTATAQIARKGKEALGKAREQGAGAAARAKEAAAPKMEGLGQKAEDALEKGAFATGRQIGRTKGMFSGFMDEYRKALNGEDGD